MPSPWKKLRAAAGSGRGGSGVSRLLAGLRPPEQGGSLVVQTGFPTSLADLVVKNRSRLKKTSRKKKTSPPASELGSAAPAPLASAAAPASSASPSSDVAHGPAGATFPDSPVPIPEEEPKSSTAREGRGLRLLLLVMLVLVVLAIEKRRKLVVGITLSAFALRLVDSMVLRTLPYLDSSRTLSSVVEDWDLEGRGIVSPIREEGVVDSPTSESGSAESIDTEPGREILPERRNILTIERVFSEHNLSPKNNSKAKKLLRKLIPKKFCRQRVHTDGRVFSDMKVKHVPDTATEIEEANNCDNDDGDSVSNSFNKVMDDHIELVQAAKCETQSKSSKLLVFGAVVLLGLVGGKSVALVLTMSWCLLHKSMESLPKNT